MNFSAEMKCIGDAYAGGFSCGMTMSRSETIAGFVKKEENRQLIRYENKEGVILTVKTAREGDTVRVKTVVANRSDRDITMEMLASFCINGIVADKIHRLQTFWSAEGKLRTETIDDLHMEPSWNTCGMRIEKFGNVGSMPVRKYFPFLALEDSKTGHVIGIQLYCASSWQMEILCKEDESLTVVGGIADRDFGHWTKRLAAGENFETPEAVIAEGNSLWEVCDKLVKAQKPVISPVDDHMGILFNEYCTTWGNPSYDNLKKICDKIADKGIQFLVIDSGWYGQKEYWWESIGDWDVNEKKFPGGLKAIADYIRSRGMIPGLWFEMESLASGSVHYNDVEHIVRKDGVPLTVGGKRFWDMEDPYVVDYLTEHVIGLLKECGFGYLKVDYNDTMGMGCDGPDGMGENLRRKIAASRRFFEKIREEIPGIVIENCSSGGHRLEPSMMALCSQASFSDAHETTAIPLIAANMHRVIQPEQSQIWAVLRATDSTERLHYSIVNTFLGRMCLSGDIYDLSEKQWEIVEKGMEFYRCAADIIQYGKTTLQDNTTPNYNHPQGNQVVVRSWNDRVLVVAHRFENSSEIAFEKYATGELLDSFGNAHCDFSAEARIYRM